MKRKLAGGGPGAAEKRQRIVDQDHPLMPQATSDQLLFPTRHNGDTGTAITPLRTNELGPNMLTTLRLPSASPQLEQHKRSSNKTLVTRRHQPSTKPNIDCF